MALSKFATDQIFTGHAFVEGYTLMVSDEGKIEGLVKTEDAGEDIQHLNGILIPGFVNVHCHLELSHLKNSIPEKTGLVDFLLQVMNKRLSTPQNILEAIEREEQNMLANGIVAVGDTCNTTDTLAKKTKGALCYHSFIETMGFQESNAMDRYQQSVAIFQAFQATAGEQATYGMTIHAPYSVSSLLFNLVSETGSLFSMHNQESAEENEFFISGTGDLLRLFSTLGISTKAFIPSGKTSLQNALAYFRPDQQLILVHNVATTSGDLDLVHTSDEFPNLYWCLCPNANLYISGLLPDVMQLKTSGAQIVVGTDSLASNHQLSILEELKTLQQYFPKITLAELLKWATYNGAKALQIDHRYGSFEIGKSPGVVVIEEMNNYSLQHAKVRRIV